MDVKEKKHVIKSYLGLSALVIIFILVAISIMKYEVEGEKNMPFLLSKIMVISTAEGVSKEEVQEGQKWNLDVMQDNDVYITINKNEEYKKEDMIEKVILENIKITKVPKKGTVKIYMPNSSAGQVYEFKQEYEVIDRLEYNGAMQSNPKTLEIGNQGGMIQIRFANTYLGEYVSSNDDVIKHDGTLISKTDANLEDLQFSVNFDLIIKTKNESYKANINLDFPQGDIINEGTGTMTKDDVSNIIFKRI